MKGEVEGEGMEEGYRQMERERGKEGHAETEIYIGGGRGIRVEEQGGGISIYGVGERDMDIGRGRGIRMQEERDIDGRGGNIHRKREGKMEEGERDRRGI